MIVTFLEALRLFDPQHNDVTTRPTLVIDGCAFLATDGYTYYGDYGVGTIKIKTKNDLEKLKEVLAEEYPENKFVIWPFKPMILKFSDIDKKVLEWKQIEGFSLWVK